VRLIWLWIPNESVAGDSYSLNLIVFNLFLTIPDIVLLVGFSLLVAFWYDTLQSQRINSPRLYNISKSGVLCFLPVMVATCTACLCAYQFGVVPAFTVLLVVLVTSIFGIVIVGVRGLFSLFSIQATEYSRENWKRVVKMSWGIFGGLILWLIYAISLIVYFSSFLILSVPAEENIFIDYLHRTLEFSFAINLLYIVDYSKNPKSLTEWICFGNENEEGEIVTVLLIGRE